MNIQRGVASCTRVYALIIGINAKKFRERGQFRNGADLEALLLCGHPGLFMVSSLYSFLGSIQSVSQQDLIYPA